MGPEQNFGQLFTGIAHCEILGYVEADPLGGSSGGALFQTKVCTKNFFTKAEWPLWLFHPNFGNFQLDLPVVPWKPRLLPSPPRPPKLLSLLTPGRASNANFLGVKHQL